VAGRVLSGIDESQGKLPSATRHQATTLSKENFEEARGIDRRQLFEARAKF
jgi:hypothetical protein